MRTAVESWESVAAFRLAAAGTAAPSGKRRQVAVPATAKRSDIARSILVLVLATLVFPCGVARAAPAPPLEKMRFDQRLDHQVPLDLPFVDETGRAVRLGDYFGKKPVILVLAYYHCPKLCTMVLTGLSEAMRQLPFTVGKEFNVVTVSFDPRETPELAAKKKETYIASYGKPGGAEGWHFLTGKQDAIDRLTEAVGFHYVYDAKQDMFYHPTGIMVLTPAGKISRYFYDVRFVPRDLRLGLVEASAEKIGSPTDQVLLFCSHYDPETGKYTANVMMFVRVGGVLTIVVLAGMIWFLMRYQRRRQARLAVAGQTASPEVPSVAATPGESS
ncbi:MAG: SCO family protein [Thermoguttaceae bacterium]|jgi:protein SCO1/2